jgi:transcriptional regulator
MYIPAANAESDLGVLHDAIERHSFAVLVSGGAGELVASHLPLMLERSRGARGTLVGHMARANGQWRSAAGSEVLAIFSGPHAYVSPAWYGSVAAVPTWNYIAVAAYGPLELIDDAAETHALLMRMMEIYDSAASAGGAEQDRSLVERLLPQIVAFRIPITRLEGKWKLSQNRPAHERGGVIAALEGQTGENAAGVAAAMRDVDRD